MARRARPLSLALLLTSCAIVIPLFPFPSLGRPLGRQSLHASASAAAEGTAAASHILKQRKLRTRQLADDSGGQQPIQIQWFLGAPETISFIGEGETVQWLWWDGGEYSVEGEGAAAGMFTGKGGGTNTVAQKGFIYNYTFDAPGVYQYHSHTYPEAMVGKVNVKARVNIGGVKLPWYDGVSYGGASAVVEEGDMVTWEWGDDLGHSLLSKGGDATPFPGPGGGTNVVAESGFQYKKTFKKAGVYLYFCPAHPQSMQGNITVLPKGSLQPPSSAPPLTTDVYSPPPTVAPVFIGEPPPEPGTPEGPPSGPGTPAGTPSAPGTPEGPPDSPAGSPQAPSTPSPPVSPVSQPPPPPAQDTAPGAASPLALECHRDTFWQDGGTTVEQHECNVKLSGDYRADPSVPGSNNGVCVQLRCSGFSPGQWCAGSSNDCSWNVGEKCTSPWPLYPGSTWNFGLHTTKGAPVVSVNEWKPAENSACSW